jgi:hypothetical protein
MSRNNVTLARAAIAIRAALASEPARSFPDELPRNAWQRCENLLRQIHCARQRGWCLAAADREDDLRYGLARVRAELADLDQQLLTLVAPHSLASATEIYRDLAVLEDEFSDWSYDRANRILSVTTAPVELEGIYLGPFDIRLHWNRIARAGADTYRVVALDPRPAAVRDDVTHPHVRDEELCEGEGREPIRRALAEGRLLDFFLLVSNLLHSYNAESPFVSLADWFAECCADCDTFVSRDERYICTRCESSLCEGCQLTCGACCDSFCSAWAASHY